MNATQRKNLLKLAAYLESLPRSYKHFDMAWFADHRGDCKLPMDSEVYAAKDPRAFLDNCGTVACAVGHGPAAGIAVLPAEYLSVNGDVLGVTWHRYSERVFGVSARNGKEFSFLFGAQWEDIDNHHYGAAARIHYFIKTGDALRESERAVREYAPYRKGSRSAKRREIEAAL